MPYVNQGTSLLKEAVVELGNVIYDIYTKEITDLKQPNL